MNQLKKPLDLNAVFLEAMSEEEAPSTGGFGGQQLKNDAMSVALSILNERLDSWEDFEQVLMAYADVSEDGIVDEDETEYYSALVSQLAHALAFLGADYEQAVKAIDKEDDGLIKALVKGTNEKYKADQRSEIEILEAYVGSKSEASLYECVEDEEWQEGLVEMSEGNFGVKTPKTQTRFNESMIKRVRGGVVKWVKKRIGRPKRLTSAQRQALRKARMKSHTGVAKRHRMKSLKMRKQRGLH